MKIKWAFLTCLLTATLIMCSAPASQEPGMTVPPQMEIRDNSADDARTILARYAEAWRGREEMPALKDPISVAFWISGEGGGEFTIVLAPDGPAEVMDGIAEDHAGGFRSNMETLRRLDRNEINAMTAMGRANWSDPADMDPVIPGGRLTPELQALFLPLTFHFWNREWPEIVPFGEGTTRFVHGGNAAIFFYDQGLRTAWYQIQEGMHINADPSDQTNPFPSLFIVTRGSIMARLDGREQRLSEGIAVLVPAGMPHEFWAGPGEYGEVIMICWGDGA
jgi:mannose-6-phosphate isomerase-like protein (cupin superfamily)